MRFMARKAGIKIAGTALLGWGFIHTAVEFRKYFSSFGFRTPYNTHALVMLLCWLVVGIIGLVLLTSSKTRSNYHSFLIAISTAFVPIGIFTSLIAIWYFGGATRPHWLSTWGDLIFQIWTFANLLGLVSAIRAGLHSKDNGARIAVLLIHLLSLLFVACRYTGGHPPNAG